MLNSIENTLKAKLKDCISTFKQTSYDKNNKIYLCDDTKTQTVYNFDIYSKKQDKAQQKASPDAIYLNKDTIYCVEFKNSELKNIKDRTMQNKFRSGAKLLKNLFKIQNLNDYQFIFCIVYKKTERAIFSERFKNFGLQDINKELNYFYDKIITKDIEYYKKEFKQLKC